MLSISILSVVMLEYDMLSIVMLKYARLNVITLSVMTPLALPPNIRPGWKDFPGEKHSNLFSLFVNDEGIKGLEHWH
jgi:hypothetical protein